MKLRLSIPSSHTLLLLGTIFIGCSTGVLWPMNGFLLKFIVGFTETLFAILIVASVVWCASTFYIFACRPFLRLFKFQKKRTFVQPSATHDDVKPIIAASAPRRDEVTAERWIGVAILTGVVALWSLLLGWTLSTAENPFIVFSGWSAVGCAAAAFGLSVIAGAFDSDEVGTLGFLVSMAGAIFTMIVLAALFASIT
jgi:hypothetical protein